MNILALQCSGVHYSDEGDVYMILDHIYSGDYPLNFIRIARVL